jgi:hypothetical protein
VDQPERVLLVTSDPELAMLWQLEAGDVLPDAAVNYATGLADGLALVKARQPNLIVINAHGWDVDQQRMLRLLCDAGRPDARCVILGEQGVPSMAQFRAALCGESPAATVREDVQGPECAPTDARREAS